MSFTPSAVLLRKVAMSLGWDSRACYQPIHVVWKSVKESLPESGDWVSDDDASAYLGGDSPAVPAKLSVPASEAAVAPKSKSNSLKRDKAAKPKSPKLPAQEEEVSEVIEEEEEEEVKPKAKRTRKSSSKVTNVEPEEPKAPRKGKRPVISKKRAKSPAGVGSIDSTALVEGLKRNTTAIKAILDRTADIPELNAMSEKVDNIEAFLVFLFNTDYNDGDPIGSLNDVDWLPED